MAWASRWIICSMKLYDEVALPEADDDAWAAADVIETFEPSA